MKKGITIGVAALSLVGMFGSTAAFAASSSKTTPHTKYQHGTDHGFGLMGSLPSILKISQATLQADLKAGNSILQIAQKQGVSEKTLITEMEKDYKTQLDKLDASKKLTATKERQMITRYDSNITKMITSTHKAK